MILPMMRLVRDDEVMELEEPLDAAPVTEPTAEPEAEAELPDGEVEEASEADGKPAPVDVALLEALLLSTHHPLTAGRLAELLKLKSVKPVRRGVTELNEQYADTGRAFRIEQVAGGYQILTLAQYGPALKALHEREAQVRLTKAALETLAIIAYKQPILRADVEAIRGVACGETIRSLMEKHLVRIAGRAEAPGRPILYGTTKRFLELFGLNSIKGSSGTESTRSGRAAALVGPAMGRE